MHVCAQHGVACGGGVDGGDGGGGHRLVRIKAEALGEARPQPFSGLDTKCSCTFKSWLSIYTWLG